MRAHCFEVSYNSFLRRTCQPCLASRPADAPSPATNFDSRAAEILKRYLDPPIISHVLYVVKNPLLPKRAEKHSKSELLSPPPNDKSYKAPLEEAAPMPYQRVRLIVSTWYTTPLT